MTATPPEGTPKIYADLVALRKLVGSLKSNKQAGGPSFAIKSSKDLMIKVRDGMDKLGMSILQIRSEGRSVVVDRGTQAEVTVTLRILSDDGSHVDVQGFGLGTDTQDKAGGKAGTYAWKQALIYSLSLPDREMVDTDDEERPTGEPAIRTVNQETALEALGKLTKRDEFAGWKRKYLMSLVGDAALAVGLAATAKYNSLPAVSA